VRDLRIEGEEKKGVLEKTIARGRDLLSSVIGKRGARKRESTLKGNIIKRGGVPRGM